MKYKELLEQLNSLDEHQLNDEVQIFNRDVDEFCQVYFDKLSYSTHDHDLDLRTPFLVI